MYQPPHFRMDDVAQCHALMRRFPLGTLITTGEGGLEANHIPFVLDTAAGPFGTLRGHLARANGQWRTFDAETEALIVFLAAEGYVTPSLYPSKIEHGKVVPTWNYVAVHARGPMRVIDDDAWLSAQIDALTRLQEGSREHPWAVSDAPAPFITAQKRGIVGVEIELSALEGKAKVSQNRPEPDRVSVHAAMDAAPDPGARLMAGMLAPHLKR